MSVDQGLSIAKKLIKKSRFLSCTSSTEEEDHLRVCVISLLCSLALKKITSICHIYSDKGDEG